MLAVVAPWAISMVCMEFVSRPMIEQNKYKIHEHDKYNPKRKHDCTTRSEFVFVCAALCHVVCRFKRLSAAVGFTQSALSSVVVAWAFAGQAAIPAKRDLYDWATSRDQNRRGVVRRITYVGSWIRWRAYVSPTLSHSLPRSPAKYSTPSDRTQ